MDNKQISGSDEAREGFLSEDQARRAFLAKAGRFAVVTPPAVTLLLGTSLGSRAIAASNGTKSKGNNGFGQEKHGAPQDGTNPGSTKGKGTAAGGPGAGKTGQQSKPNGTGLR